MPMIFFFAVLIAIPKDYIEAARVDGASSWKIFWQITFPLVLPMLGIITIVTYVANFNAFDLSVTVKGALGGPDGAADCPYCGQRFALAEGAKAGAGH